MVAPFFAGNDFGYIIAEDFSSRYNQSILIIRSVGYEKAYKLQCFIK